MRLTVAGDIPISAAICLPVWRCRRNASTVAHVAAGVWPGNEWGREERSRSPSTPSVRKRVTHLATIVGDVELARGCGLAEPSFNNTAHHGLSTFGRKGAFLWVSIRFSANRWWFGDFSVPGLGRMDNLLKAHI